MATGRKHTMHVLPDGTPRRARAAMAGQTQDPTRYLMPDGTVRWLWDGAVSPLVDSFCMAGRRTRVWLHYCVDEAGDYVVHKHCQYPFLTAAGYAFGYEQSPVLYVGDFPLHETVRFVDIRGQFVLRCTAGETVEVDHVFYPAMQSVGLVEHIVVRNMSPNATLRVRLQLPFCDVVDAHASVPVVSGASLADADGRMLTDLDEEDIRVLAPEAEGHYYVVYWSKPRHEDLMVDCRLEYKKRQELVSECFEDTLSISTPEPMLDRAFAHALVHGFEHIADTPLGSMLYVNGAYTSDTCRIAPLLLLSGYHRGQEALQNMLVSIEEQINLTGKVPLGFDAAGHAVKEGELLPYALACALDGLLSGGAALSRRYALVERIAEDARAHCRDNLYAPRGTADLVQQCQCYALFRLAYEMAIAMDNRPKAHLWQETARSFEGAINTRYGGNVAGFDTYRIKGRKLHAAVYAPLLVGIDVFAQGTARALVSRDLYDAAFRLRHSAKCRHRYDADLSLAACALLLSGFTELGVVMLCQYTQSTLLSDHAPYPLTEAGGKQDPISALLYCQSMLLGLLGITCHRADSVGFCLHLPKAWRTFRCRGLHVGGSVLNLTWQDSHLTVCDIFGNILYDDLALSGQHITVALPRVS